MARSHVDASVAERRLKPIYDCLDNGNNKKALQEAEKLLKKQKDFKCAKVLKALAMLRLGRQSECEVIMEEVRANEPVDEPTLQAMTICYRELQRLDQVVEIFEKACSKEPQNEDLLSHLFMSHVRMGNYKKQQQVAMSLYKLKPKKPYYLWSVMSIYMQALEGEQNLAQAMLLPLAQKMVTKFIKDNGIEDKNELQLQLMILEGKSEFEEALELLNHPQSSLLNISSMPDYLSYQRACYLNHLKRYPESASAFKQLIDNRPEQWDYYLKYFDAVEELEKLGWEPSEIIGDSNTDHNLTMALDFISKKILDSPKPIRSSYVARIELLKRLKLKEETEELEEKLLERLFEYYQIFGTKPGGMPDMMAFLETIPLKEITLSTLLDKIYTNSAKDKTPTNVNQLYRHIIYYHLAQYGGYFKKMDVASKLKLIEELYEHYKLGLTFGNELLSTDYQYSDSYSLLIVILLLEVWEETKQEKYYINALAHLELTLKNSESNFHIKLVLIKLYNMIGACGATYDIYKSLDIKHIQQETLGHMFSYPLFSVGHHILANQIVIQALRFYTSNFKDTVDYLISAYRFGQFTKIPEIVKFKRKLANSLYSNTIIVEQMLQDLFVEVQSPQIVTRIFNSMKLDPEKESIDYSQLTDNKDTSCIRNWKKEDAVKMKEFNKKSAQEEVQWLKFRKLLLRCLSTAHLLGKHGQREGSASPVSNISNGVNSSIPTLLPKLIEEIKLHMESIDPSTLNRSWFPISYPGPSRLVRLFERPTNLRLILSMLELVVYINQGDLNEESELILKSTFIEDYKGFLNELRKNYLENGTDLSLQESRNILEDLTNGCETFIVVYLLAHCCFAFLKPTKAGMNKKKKKATSSKEIQTLANFNLFLDGLKQVANSYLVLIEDIKNQFELHKLSNLSLNSSPNFITEEMSKLAVEKINKSYSSSFNELSQLIKNKLRLLEALVC